MRLKIGFAGIFTVFCDCFGRSGPDQHDLHCHDRPCALPGVHVSGKRTRCGGNNAHHAFRNPVVRRAAGNNRTRNNQEEEQIKTGSAAAQIGSGGGRVLDTDSNGTLTRSPG